MTSATQAGTTGFPLVIPTRTQAPTARLLLRNDLGQVVQQWLIRQNKCTLGSSASCALRCEMPGVAPYHALLVVGARQIFVRALAPKLTRDGNPVNEILLTEENGSFEIAGHRFELTRGAANEAPETQTPENAQNRLKFTLARPYELNSRPKKPAVEVDEKPTNTGGNSDSKWVAQLIQAAIEPLECQLQNLLEPLAELQSESRRQQERLEQQLAEDFLEEPAQPLEDTEPSAPQLTREIEEITAKQSAAMDVITERISDVNHQLSAIERIIVEDRDTTEEAPTSDHDAAQSAAIDQLQSGMVSVSNALQDLETRQQAAREEDQAWKSEIQGQITSLRESVDAVAKRAEEQAAAPRETEDDVAWKADIQNQFALLREAVDRVAERAEAAQLAAVQSSAELSAPPNADQDVPPSSEPISADTAPQDLQAELVIEADHPEWLEETLVASDFSSGDTLGTCENVGGSSDGLAAIFETYDLSSDSAFQVPEVTFGIHDAPNVQSEEDLASVEDAEVGEAEEESVSTADAESTSEAELVAEVASPEPSAEAEGLDPGEGEVVTESSTFEELATAEEETSLEYAPPENAVPENATWSDVGEGASPADAVAEAPLLADDAPAEEAAGEEPMFFGGDVASEESPWSRPSEASHSDQSVQDGLEPNTTEASEEQAPQESDEPEFPTAESWSSNTSDTPEEEHEVFWGGELQSAEPQADAAALWEAPAEPAPPFSSDPEVSEDVGPWDETPVENSTDDIGFSESVESEPNLPPGELPTEEFHGNSFFEGGAHRPGEVASFLQDIAETPPSGLDVDGDGDSGETFSHEASPENAWEPAQEPTSPPNETASATSESTDAHESNDDPTGNALPDWWTEEDRSTTDSDEVRGEYGSDGQPFNFGEAASDAPTPTWEDAAPEPAEGAVSPPEASTGLDEFSPLTPLESDDAPEASHNFGGVPEDSQKAADELPAEDASSGADPILAVPDLSSYQQSEPAIENADVSEPGVNVPDSPIQETAGDSTFDISALGSSALGDPALKDPAFGNTAQENSAFDNSASEELALGEAASEDGIVQTSSPADAAFGEDSDPATAEAPTFEENPAAEENLAVAEEASATEDSTLEDDEQSVEDYMRKLLARMRNTPEDEVDEPSPSTQPISAADASTVPTPAAADTQPNYEEPLQAAEMGTSSTVPDTEPTEEATEPFDPNKYVPRVLAPEKVRNLAAMRELANSSARTAINKSTRQRHLTSVMLKLSIAGIGLIVGSVLIAINGFHVNIGLIATIAAFLVAAIWGYDAATSLKPLMQAGLVLKPVPEKQPAAEVAPESPDAG